MIETNKEVQTVLVISSEHSEHIFSASPPVTNVYRGWLKFILLYLQTFKFCRNSSFPGHGKNDSIRYKTPAQCLREHMDDVGAKIKTVLRQKISDEFDHWLGWYTH